MRVFIFVMIMVACAVSCKKSKTISPTLFGKWELRKRYNGNIRDSVYAAGNGNIIQFNSDNTFARYTPGQATVTGTYHITENNYRIDQNLYSTVSFTDMFFNSVVIMNNDQLTLKPLMPDAATTDYQKIQN